MSGNTRSWFELPWHHVTPHFLPLPDYISHLHISRSPYPPLPKSVWCFRETEAQRNSSRSGSHTLVWPWTLPKLPDRLSTPVQGTRLPFIESFHTPSIPNPDYKHRRSACLRSTSRLCVRALVTHLIYYHEHSLFAQDPEFLIFFLGCFFFVFISNTANYSGLYISRKLTWFSKKNQQLTTHDCSWSSPRCQECQESAVWG